MRQREGYYTKIHRGVNAVPYCLYLRKSRADIELEARGEMETLSRHETALLELARKMQLPISAIYKELVSGESIDARPVMQQLLDEVETGQWEGVLVMEVERLARGDTIDQGVVAKAFRETNTKIITPIKTYDPSNEFDEEYFEFGLFMSRREYRTINRRIQRGRVQSAREGKFLSSVPPYGYDKVRIESDKGYTLRPNADADVVRQIFDWYVKGEGCSVIADRLDNIGLRPPRSDRWSKCTVRDIIRNPVYIGKIRWSYKKEKKTDGHKTRTLNDDPIMVDGLHPPIISAETFQSAAVIMERNTRRPIKKSLTLQNPLAGLGYCAKCGSLMTRLGPNNKTHYSTLKCTNRHCDNISAPLDLVETVVVNHLRAWLAAYRVQLEQTDTKREERAIKRKALDSAESELQKAKKQLLKTYDMLEQGVYSIDVFTERQKALSEKIQQIENLCDTLQAEQKKAENITRQLQALPKLSDSLDAYYQLPTAEDRNKLLKLLLIRFEYVKNEPNRRGQRDRTNFDVKIYPSLPE